MTRAGDHRGVRFGEALPRESQKAIAQITIGFTLWPDLTRLPG